MHLTANNGERQIGAKAEREAEMFYGWGKSRKQWQLGDGNTLVFLPAPGIWTQYGLLIAVGALVMAATVASLF